MGAGILVFVPEKTILSASKWGCREAGRQACTVVLNESICNGVWGGRGAGAANPHNAI